MPADSSVPETRMGRPPKLTCDEETLKAIEGLARIQCTMVEAAAVLHVHRDTFSDFLRANEKAMQAWEDGRESGKASLRRNQWKMSETNPTMAIWLGKQWLDQTDKSYQEIAGKDGEPIQQEVSFSADAFTRTIAGLAARSGEDGEAGGSGA